MLASFGLFPVQFVQTSKQIIILYEYMNVFRVIPLNAKHNEDAEPTYLGDSVAHWEGDTLVVDSVGMNDKTYIDSYRTPHTDKLHVVERFRMIDGGKTMEVKLHVEDPGAFTTPWDAIQRYRRIDASGDKNDSRVPRDGLEEMACAENNGDILGEGLDPIPTAARPDF